MHKKNTLFIGKVSRHFPVLPSTNTYALELLSKSAPIEGTVISTDNQTQGRGQIGSRWESEAGKNLTASVILYPRFLPVKDQFLLNETISLGVSDLIMEVLGDRVRIKWPNDIYVGDRKIAGLLIQNTLSGNRFQATVAGIGINVNQTDFSKLLPNPTSLSLETGRTYDLPRLMDKFCHALEKRYFQLKRMENFQIKKTYFERLYRFKQTSEFKRADGSSFSGKIVGVDHSGKLQIETKSGEECFSLKEVALVQE